MPSNQRGTVSRAKEFDLMFSFLDSPNHLKKFIKANPDGGVADFEGIKFEFGNINRLVVNIKIDRMTKSFTAKPVFVCHLDSVSAERKREIEDTYGVQRNSIAGENTKADLFFIDTAGRAYFVSVKDSTGLAKLGQVSRDAKYGTAVLNGGLNNFDIPLHVVPDGFASNQTNLTKNQFSRIGLKDQKFAYYKRQFPKEWKKIVETSEFDALEQIRKFGSDLTQDKSNLIEFIGETFAGNLKASKDFYILFNRKVINFSEVMRSLELAEIEVQCEEHKPRDKTSIIIWLNIKEKKYCLTKVEASFDGKRSNVLQTKGLIFYFQQHLKTGNNYKQLFFDMAK